MLKYLVYRKMLFFLYRKSGVYAYGLFVCRCVRVKGDLEFSGALWCLGKLWGVLGSVWGVTRKHMWYLGVAESIHMGSCMLCQLHVPSFFFMQKPSIIFLQNQYNFYASFSKEINYLQL